ncbi:hypothetical protein Tco_1355002 [Tanacetum coccineum]
MLMRSQLHRQILRKDQLPPVPEQSTLEAIPSCDGIRSGFHLYLYTQETPADVSDSEPLSYAKPHHRQSPGHRIPVE